MDKQKQKSCSTTELIKKMRQGDEEAFKEIYTEIYPKLYFITYSILKDIHLAQDAVQETFFNVLINIDDLKSNSSFLPWIRRIAYNTSLQMIKKNVENPAGDDLQIHMAGSEEFIDKLLKTEEREEIIKLILDLPLINREVIILRYYEGFRMSEIASLVGCPVGTVKSRLHHAKRTLRKRIEENMGKVVTLAIMLPVCMRGAAIIPPLGNGEQKAEAAELWLAGGLGLSGAPVAASVSAAAAAPGLIAGLVVSTAGLVIGGFPAGLRIEGYQGGYTNQPVTISIEANYPFPVSTVSVRHQNAAVDTIPDLSEGIPALGGLAKYQAVINENGRYEVEVIMADGKKVAESFIMTRIDRKKPEVYWYAYDFDKNILSIYVKDDLSGLELSQCLKRDREGVESPPLSWNGESDKMVFGLTREPFVIELPDRAGNHMTYQVIPYKVHE